MRREWQTVFRWGAGAFLLYLCVLYWSPVSRFLGTLAGAALPLLVGCAVAYPVDILAGFYERRFPKGKARLRRAACVIAAYLSLLVLAGLVLRLMVPQLVSCVRVILQALQEAAAELPALLARWGVFSEDILEKLADIDWAEKLGEVVQLLLSGLGSTVSVVVDALSSVFSGIVTAFLSLIFSIYLLMGKEKLGRQLNTLAARYLKRSWHARLRHVLAAANGCFRRYIVGQCTEAVILGVLCMAGMLLLRLPYAMMIGTLIGATALIPIAGAYLGAGAGALMIVVDAPVKALVFLIFIVVLQQLEGNLIYPKVVGSSIGLPAVWVFAAVTVGGGVMGILGMLLAVPLTATVYQLLAEDVHRDARSPGAERGGDENETEKEPPA